MNTFGFTGREIYPIDDGISLLHSADLDGDGLNDLIVVNNLRSKINILYNRTGKTNEVDAKPPRKLEINELPPDARFRIDSIPVDEHIGAMVVTDLNGDGRPDIAFYGDGKDLEVIYNLGTNGWSDPKRWHIDDGQMTPNALADGDLNGDGRTDLVLIGDNGSLYFFAQNADHTLAEPQKISYSGTPKAVQIVDVDGDGKNDLLLVDFDSPTPLRFRLQNSSGQLGPEIYFKIPPFRSFDADNLGGDAKNYVVTIAQSSGARAGLAVHAQAGGSLVRRISSGAISNPSADNSRRGAARPALGGCQRRRASRPARGRAGERPAFGLFAAGRWFTGPGKNLPDARGREPDCGGGSGRRRQAEHFSFKPGRTRGRRDAV